MNVTHGKWKTPTYMSWHGLKGRCLVKSNGCYERYGGRGIKVCERWLGRHGFENFLADMGERPPGMSIDRIDVNGNYEPSNCRWANDTDQRRNTRATVLESHQPAEIRRMASLGLKHREIASQFGINREIVSKIVRNERWHDPNYVYVPKRALPR